MPHPRTGIDRSITAAGLARLLTRLDPDPERAALEYERLRRALIKFFDWRGRWPPEECADEALDRVARKLEEGTIVEDLWSYAHGIARLILLERRRWPIFSPLGDVPNLASGPPQAGGGEDKRRGDCFDHCLARIPSESRSLLLRYYEGEGHAKIVNRRRLAESLGLSENALRSRVQRLRDSLEDCVGACVSGQREDSQ